MTSPALRFAPEYIPEPPVLSLVFDQYLERLKRKKKSPYTISGFLTAARRLDAWLLERGLTAERATVEDLDEYFDLLQLAPSSKATHLRMIQAAYNYAIRRGTIRHNPALDLEVEAPATAEPRIIPNGELRAIREGIALEHDWVLFHLLAYAGLRRSEIHGAIWDEEREHELLTRLGAKVRLPDQTIVVFGKGKRGQPKLRVVPIHPALGEVLIEARESKLYVPGGAVITARAGKPVAIDTFQAMTKRLHETYTPHDYRRTVHTSLRRNGVSQELRDRIMGWMPGGIGGRYYDNVAEPELHRAILRLYADEPL